MVWRHALSICSTCYGQGRINHWANRANTWGLALLGALRLNVKTPLYCFLCFYAVHHSSNMQSFLITAYSIYCRLRKLTTLAFIVFEWLTRIEPNSTTLNDPRIRSKSVHPLASAEVFPGWQRHNFAHGFQVADDAMKMDVHKTLFPFYPLVCAGWTSILNLLSQMFSTLRLSEMLILFINCLISIFSSTFYN